MMRRLLLSSAKPHQPHHHRHHHHTHNNHHHQDSSRHSNDNERQRRLYAAEKMQANTSVRVSGQNEALGKQSYRVSKGIRRGRSLARTRSESDLIRAMAKNKANKRKSFSSDSDDESEDSSTSSEDESRRATSLRSFTKEDEERYAVASWNSAFPGEVCSKIGEEDDEQSCTLKSSHHEQLEEVNSGSNPMPTSSGSSSTKQSTASPLSDSSALSVQEPELKSINAPSTVSPLNDEETKTHWGSESGNESTSATTQLLGSEVDVEYLLHENDLLKNSLEQVIEDRDYLAQDNWNLRVELENLRNQMRFLMTASASPTMYDAPARVSYRTGSPPAYTDARNTTYSQHDYGYGRYGQPCTETFEELMRETAR